MSAIESQGGADHSAAVIARRVRKCFGSVTALDDLSLTIRPGTISGLVGPNGSGKSTFLACLVGIEPVTAGKVEILGAPAGSEVAKQFVSFTPDDLAMPDLLTGREYLELVCELEGRRRQVRRAHDFADAFGIAVSLDKLIGSYSHGMRRRLQFSAALSSQCPVLVMDEPFSGLDVEGAVLLRGALQQWRADGGTVVLTVHDLGSAQKECDEVVVLSNGMVVAAGVPDELIRNSGAASLEDFVLEMSETAEDLRDRVALIRGLVADSAASEQTC